MKTKFPHRISDPYTFENLSVFLLHGEDTLPQFQKQDCPKADQKHRSHRYHAIWSLMAEENGC
jgi:hypothetical protein